MQKLSKLMLAAVAAIALATPAMAWDFGVTGTATAGWNMATEKDNSTDTTTTSSMRVSSAGSNLKLASGHTDGDKTVSFSYTIDYDGNLDETVSASGSTKVGDWTASGGVSYNRGFATTGTTGGGSAQTGEDTTSVTVTDGTMTIVLGDAAHLSSQSKGSGGSAGGRVCMDTSTCDYGVGAYVGGFHGVSLGYKVSDTMNVTVALQQSGDDNDSMGSTINIQDAEAATHDVDGMGLSLTGSAGEITYGLTFANAKTKDPTGGSSTLTTSWSTLGLGVGMTMGATSPFFSYGSASATGSSTSNKYDVTGLELGATHKLGDDTIVFDYTTVTTKTTTAGTAGKPETWTGIELGYGTTVGPASLDIGYGTRARAQTDGANGGYSSTDLDVTMVYSF